MKYYFPLRIQDAKYVSPITLQSILRDVQAYAALKGLEIIVILNNMKYTNFYERLGILEDKSYGEKIFEAVEDIKLNRLITHNSYVLISGRCQIYYHRRK